MAFSGLTGNLFGMRRDNSGHGIILVDIQDSSTFNKEHGTGH